MNTTKVVWPCILFGTLLLLAGCGQQADQGTAAAAPGVTPPKTIAPPPPATVNPQAMALRRQSMPQQPAKP